MKKDWAALSGWVVGVFTAATALLALALLETRGRGFPMGAAPVILMSVILGPGPGLLILSAWISARLKRRHAGGAGRGSTLALGTLIGGLAGTPAVLLVPLLFFGTHILRSGRETAVLIAAVGVLSGAASGLTCAWRVSRPS